MIETTELRLELLRIVKDKNGSEVDEIIHNANKLFDWVNYDPSNVEKDVEKDKPTNPVEVFDTEDDKVIENMILNNLLYFYKLHGSMDSIARTNNKIEHSIIPQHWDDTKKDLYKRLIDVINTRCIYNSGFKSIIKPPLMSSIAKECSRSQSDNHDKFMANVKVEDFISGEEKLVLEPTGEIPNIDPNSRDSFESDEAFKNRLVLVENYKKMVEQDVKQADSELLQKLLSKEHEVFENKKTRQYSEEANKVADFYDMSESKFPVGAI